MSPRARSEAANAHRAARAHSGPLGAIHFGSYPFSLLDQISDIVIAFDPEGWVTYANHSAAPFLDPVIADPAAPDERPADRRRADGLYPAHIWRHWQNTASAQPCTVEDWRWQGRRPDGSVAWLEGQLHPLLIEQRGLGGLLCIAHAAPPDQAAEAPAPQWVAQALRESERRFREVLENVQLVAVTLDTAGNITFCNDFLLELTGWERAEVLGRNWHATFIPPDLRDTVWHLFQDDIAHNTVPAHHENDIQTRQGERRCISWNNTILRDPQGRLIGTASIGEDITARRHADHALQASEARFRLMFTNNPIAMWVYDRESLRFLEVNEATCARYGYRRDELLTMHITDIRPAEDVPRLRAFLASHPPSVRDAGEWRHRTKDGRMIDVQIGAHELTFAGRPAALVVAEDITERKQAQERFAKAFHASPDATIIVRLRDRQIVDVNASWLETTGYTRDEIIGHTMNELDVWASQAERERMYSLVQQHGFIREVEFAYRRRTGEIRWRVMSVELIEIAGEPCLLAMGRDVTERRQAEQALRRSEQRFAKAFHASPDAMCILRLTDQQIIDVNHGWEQLTGRSRDGAVGYTLKDFQATLDLASRERLQALFEEEGSMRDVEVAFRRPSGETRLCNLSVEVTDINGEPCLLIIGRDITARKQAENALRESERQFRAVFDTALDAMLVSDNSRRYVNANPAACALFDLPREELIGREVTDFSATSNMEAAERGWQHFLAHGQMQGEITIRTARGAQRAAEYTAVANFLPGQHLTVLRDITERQRAEEALRRSEERFAKAFRASPQGLLIMRAADEQIIDVNDSWLNMMGYSRDEVLGQPAEQFNIWADAADRDQMQLIWQEQGALRDYEVAIRHKSGEVRYISTSTETIEIDGEPCVLSIHQDITERKQMEERVRAAERLGALGRVAAGVAHEFNNILAGIMGRLDLLALEVREPGPTTTLHIIQQAVEDGATVVQRVQAFSRLRTLDAPVPVAVSELVNDVVSMTQPRWHTLPEQQGRALTLRTQIEQGLVVQGNPTELREVLTNLIFNAIDASPHGGQITIGAEAHQGRVVITLQDTGTGMDALTQERIFEPFFTTKISGTGLGLAVVKDIVRSHGGQITVQSMVGQGSVFTITLPVAPPAPAPVPAPAALPGASADLQPARILAIDDDPGLGDMLRAMLAVGGHEVLVAASGPEALALLDHHSFDLVCTDLGMPGMNGWEVARQVRVRAPGIPIALVTGWGVHLDPAELAANTVDFVLPKPYRVAQVQELVAQALARRKEQS